MNKLRRGFAGAVAFSLALALLLPAGAGAAVTVTYTKESLPAFEGQLSHGQVEAVTFNKKVRSLRVNLRNGEHVLVRYPKHQVPAVEAKLKAAHVHFTVLTTAEANKELKEKPKHHKLRYIAGGALLVVIVIVGVVLVARRHRQRD
jgi:hypothetical protein